MTYSSEQPIVDRMKQRTEDERIVYFTQAPGYADVPTASPVIRLAGEGEILGTVNYDAKATQVQYDHYDTYESD